MTAESGPNTAIAIFILLKLLEIGIFRQLIKPGKCEVQVPVLQAGDAANRFPDLVVLREEHLSLIQRRLTITLDMPPPRLVIEVVNRGKANHDRDYRRKWQQYAQAGISEYWIVDPQQQIVTVWKLAGSIYREVGRFAGAASIVSREFPTLSVTAAAILAG